jgi:hypothetical protein
VGIIDRALAPALPPSAPGLPADPSGKPGTARFLLVSRARNMGELAILSRKTPNSRRLNQFAGPKRIISG